MNLDTRISVHCYAGDAHQVVGLLPMYRAHGCPITVMSPDDSRVVIDGVDCRFAGDRRASLVTNHRGETVSVGQGSIDRHRAHMEILLSYSENFFFMCDSDSFCLSPQFPDYLYRAPGTAWCNLVPNPIPEHHVDGLPDTAMHPPWFFSRGVIERLLAADKHVTVNPAVPFIDDWLKRCAVYGGIDMQRFPDGFAGDIDRNGSIMHAERCVKAGAIFIHSAKHPMFWDRLQRAYASRFVVPRIAVPQRGKGVRA